MVEEKNEIADRVAIAYSALTNESMSSNRISLILRLVKEARHVILKEKEDDSN